MDFNIKEYTFQITMRQMWVDQRLEYEHIKEQKKIPESESLIFPYEQAKHLIYLNWFDWNLSSRLQNIVRLQEC